MFAKEFAISVYVFLAISATVPAMEEEMFILGGKAGWDSVPVRHHVAELSSLRPRPVISLASYWTAKSGNAGSDSAYDDIKALYAAYRNNPAGESDIDAAFSFDGNSPADFADSEGNYTVVSRGETGIARHNWARNGGGAALFSGLRDEGTAPLEFRPQKGALFAPGGNMRDFSLEFWLFPGAMENGEQILSWSADLRGKPQRIFCETSKNRVIWSFKNFFSGVASDLPLVLRGRKQLVPRQWTHHLIRFNSDTGLLEYTLNGVVEDAVHVTSTGSENGDIFIPETGIDGAFILGSRFSGMIDEFRIYRRWIEIPGRSALDKTGPRSVTLPQLAKFPAGGGRFESAPLDLGDTDSPVLRIEATGGFYSISRTGGKNQVNNSYSGECNFRFANASSVQFYYRMAENPFEIREIPWTPVMAGSEIHGSRGRYIQVAASLYPGADCETSPYLEEIRIVYERNEAPCPPSLIHARAEDGAVELSWRKSPDEDCRGYLVYYGTSSGLYYGEDAIGGESPIDAGSATSVRIEGLKNGTLYFFAVAAYDRVADNNAAHAGKFSKEVRARPLRSTD